MAIDCGNRLVTIEPLRRDQYRQSAEWEYGPQDNADWDKFIGQMEQPNWLHFGVYLDADFCASVSLEKMGRICRWHVSKAPHTIRPQELAHLLITMADFIFQQDIDELEALIIPNNRAARRLAIRSWMAFKSATPDGDIYHITRLDYYAKSKADAAGAAVFVAHRSKS